MKKILLTFIMAIVSLTMMGQSDKAFRAYIYNNEYKVYMDINFYEQDVIVPDQELFGSMPGYFGAERDVRKWLITSFKFEGENKAVLQITNDYGSEDLTAQLIYDKTTDTYTLKQISGSRLKIVVNRKWVKIPNEIVFTPSKRK